MNIHAHKGITLVETLVAIAFFLAVALALYGVYTKLIETTAILHVKTVAASLANEQFEIIRNMPYADVGTDGGIPSGILLQNQTLTRDGIGFEVLTTIRNIDEPFDGMLGGSPNDLSPADNKLVAIELTCIACKNAIALEYTTHIAPKNLETASTNGALVIQVFDANGLPVSEATITVDNVALFPEVHITDVTGIDGTLTIVDAPPATDSYEITVTKDGYSSEQTYPVNDINNPNPSKPHQTVLIQQITQITFSIDKVSELDVQSIFDTCAAVPNFDFDLTGSKIIGTSPNILKYDVSHTTDGTGGKQIDDLEWDTYNIVPSDGTYDLIGTNPLLSIGLPPDALQNMQLVVAPKAPNRLLVIVRDQTGLAVTGASVRLEGPNGYDETKITGRGYRTQTDWSGGSGQDTIGDVTSFFASDGNIETGAPNGDIKLKDVFGTYFTDGWLASSTFDTNTLSNFHQIYWTPQSQAIEVGAEAVRFQVAANNDNLTWNYVGPDSTGGTYFSISDNNLPASLDNNRYFRYRVFLSTEDTNFTPSISDISFTFTTSCTSPGQVAFGDLEDGEYTVMVTTVGYQDYAGTIDVAGDWLRYELTITP